MRIGKLSGLLAVLFLLPHSRCVVSGQDDGSRSPQVAKSDSMSAEETEQASVIDEDTLRAHIRFLADDLLEGRGPGSRGDAITQLYIATQFQSLGLKPASVEGTWLQPVPLVGVRTIAPAAVEFKAGDQTLALQSSADFMATMGSPKKAASIESAEVIFVGYGIQAPEYGWDDFKGIDLRGKVLLMMNNDPADDPALFEGRK